MYDWSLKKLKRLIVAVIGITILVIGIVMIVLPGPAMVVIPLPNQSAIFVGSSKAPQRTICTPSSPSFSPP